MLGFPQSTVYDRRIPKQRFYENLSVTPELKRVFVEQINLIFWKNKLAPSTINVEAGADVTEIEVMEIRLNQQSLDKRVLRLIDREIPYHILFVLAYEGSAQAWIAYKESSRAKAGTFKPRVYYHTEWQSPETLTLRLEGLNMDSVYEGFVRQIARDRLNAADGGNLRDSVIRSEKRQRLLREIAALENKIYREKQFNRQVEMNAELKRLKQKLEGLR